MAGRCPQATFLYQSLTLDDFSYFYPSMTNPTWYSFTHSPIKVLGLLIGLVLVVRFFSFFPSVIDHDESTYIVIADALSAGQVYLRDVVDTKPIGIFTLFAIFQTLFGKSIVVIRIITALWVALTGWMIYLVHRQLIADAAIPGHNPAPFASGMIFVCIMSIFTGFGISPNTEHFFVLFSITALYLVVRYDKPLWMLVAGLLLGIGFMIKYVVLFDALAIGLFYLWQQVTAGKKWSYWLTRCTLMAIGFVIPFSIVWIYYLQMDMGSTFLYYSFQVSGQYFILPPWYKYVLYVLDGLWRFFPVTIWFFYCLWHWRSTGPAIPLLSGMWGVLALIIILLPGKMFPHYFIQFMVPLSLLAGSFFDVRRSPGKALAWIRKPGVGYIILVILVITNVFLQKKDYFDKRDYPREVAAYLNANLKPGDIIYTGNAYQILYFLTGTRSPTPYVHPSLLWTIENNQALGINQQEEWNKILDQNPRFLIVKKELPAGHPMLAVLGTTYAEVKSFGKEVRVYERK